MSNHLLKSGVSKINHLSSHKRTTANARGKTWSVVALRLKATAMLSWAILIMVRSIPGKTTRRRKTHTIHTTRWRSCSRRMYTMRRVVHVPVAPLTLTPQSLLLVKEKLLKVNPSLAILTMESSRLFWLWIFFGLRVKSRLWFDFGFWRGCLGAISGSASSLFLRWFGFSTQIAFLGILGGVSIKTPSLTHSDTFYSQARLGCSLFSVGDPRGV
ncbi:hypothetical protein SEVIR_7G001505v4 [Setaria viridis]|uniref:Uncharacterized protein n=1 Tax=Setaria viridis TaxID=4556 RepID=A0A4U6TR10_SETVI|nr:hypothetical protein SEVIR_7G001505v2 [Setaria viridis]